MLLQEASQFGHVIKKQFQKPWYIESYSAFASGDEQSNNKELLRSIFVLIENSNNIDCKFCQKSDQTDLIAVPKIKVLGFDHQL